jgi:hypothetical protein
LNKIDSLYIITTPDTANGEILSVGDVVDQMVKLIQTILVHTGLGYKLMMLKIMYSFMYHQQEMLLETLR